MEHAPARGQLVLRIREKVASVPGEAIGKMARFVPGTEVIWHAPTTRYRLFGIRVTVDEAVTWRVHPRGQDATALSAHV